MEGRIRMLNIIITGFLKERKRKMKQKQFEELMNTTFIKLMKDIKPFFQKIVTSKQGKYERKSTPDHISNC